MFVTTRTLNVFTLVLADTYEGGSFSKCRRHVLSDIVGRGAASGSHSAQTVLENEEGENYSIPTSRTREIPIDDLFCCWSVDHVGNHASGAKKEVTETDS